MGAGALGALDDAHGGRGRLARVGVAGLVGYGPGIEERVAPGGLELIGRLEGGFIGSGCTAWPPRAKVGEASRETETTLRQRPADRDSDVHARDPEALRALADLLGGDREALALCRRREVAAREGELAANRHLIDRVDAQWAWVTQGLAALREGAQP